MWYTGFMNAYLRKGFTMVELLVVLTIMGILAAVLLANMTNSGKVGRDAQRQSDLRNLQSAVESYKHKYGVYPLGGSVCSVSGGQWATEKSCSTYIEGLTPEFIDRLPRDPAIRSNNGFSYVTNDERSVYKIMVWNTVEADVIDYEHPFKSCDIRPDENGNFQYVNANNINKGGWCAYVINSDGDILGDVAQCKSNSASHPDNGNGRFDKSYAVWGGFANEGTGAAINVSLTTDIICK